MNVRCPPLDSVQHHLVDEPYDGGVGDVRAGDISAHGLVVAAGHLEVFEIEILLLEARHRRIDGFDGSRYSSLQLVLLNDDRLDTESRLKLDLIKRVQIGRVAYRDVETLTALQDRQDPVLGQQLVVDQAYYIQIWLNGVQIEKRNAKLVSGSDRDLPGGPQFVFNQVRDQGAALVPDRFHGRQQVLLCDDAVLHQPARKPGQGLLGCDGGHFA